MGDEFVLVYFGNSQPSFKVLETLPDSVTFHGELIDTWNMTITPIDGPITNKTRITLPGWPYVALRLEKAL